MMTSNRDQHGVPREEETSRTAVEGSPQTALPPGMGRVAILLVTLGLEGSFILIALIVGPFVGFAPLSLVRWDGVPIIWGTLLALTIFAVVVISVETDARFFRDTTKLVEEVVERLFGRCTLFDLLVISILAGVGEELLFRGMIQHGLTAAFGWILALVGTSLLFGAAHFVSASYFWYASVFGLFAGSLFLLTDNLIAPIVAHVVYDFLALTYLMRRLKRKKSTPFRTRPVPS